MAILMQLLMARYDKAMGSWWKTEQHHEVGEVDDPSAAAVAAEAIQKLLLVAKAAPQPMLRRFNNVVQWRPLQPKLA